MPASNIYEYALIRLVPRVEREEFLNVGAILYCKKKDFLQVRVHLDKDRLRAFAPDLDLPEVERYLRTWELISSGSTEGGPIARLDTAGRFRWLTATRSTMIQASRVHPGLCDDAPEKTLEELYRKYVL